LQHTINPYATKLIFEYELRAIFRDRGNLLRIICIEPLAYLFLLVGGLKGLSGNHMVWGGEHFDYITFVYPGVLALQFLRTFTHSVYRFTIDRRWGLQALKIASGIDSLSYIIGMVATPTALFVIQTVITLPFALLLGVQMSFVGIFILLFQGMLAVFCWTLMAAAITAFFKNYTQRDLFLSFILLPLTFTAPVFYSMDKAAFYLQIISKLNPFSYQVIAMRQAFLFESFSFSFFTMLVCAVLLLCSTLYSLGKGDLINSEV